MSDILETLKIQNQKIVLDFCKNNYITINSKQYDNNTRCVPIQLTNNGKPVVLDSSKFYACIKLLTPDNRAILDEVKIEDDGTLSLILTESMLYYPGKANAEIRVYDRTNYKITEVNDESEDGVESNSKLLSTMNFNILINASTYSDDLVIEVNKYEFNVLTELIEKAVADYTVVMEDARSSANAAKESENNAKISEENAADSATMASTKATAAANSANVATTKSNAAETFAANAANSEANAKTSETNAKTSEQNAKASETKAANLATTATNKATDATNSATAAATSATNAKTSETNAKASEQNAKSSESNAKTYMDTAKEKAESAQKSEENAITKATEASNSATSAVTSATNAGNSERKAIEMANISKSYAVGSNGEIREGDNTDNAQYYYEQSKRIAQGVSGIIYMGTVTFADLSNPDNRQTNYMFNISEAFTTDDTFKEGAGHTYGAGVNVCRTADGYWDALVGSTVTGVKGNAETTYRTGNVNITAKDIGIPNPEVVSESEPTDQETGAFWMQSY